MIISKEKFISYIEFIKEKRKHEQLFCETLETLSPDAYCDAFLFSEYESKLINLLEIVFNDRSELISYKLYEFDTFSEKDKLEQTAETPEVRTWEMVYDYLVSHLDEE